MKQIQWRILGTALAAALALSLLSGCSNQPAQESGAGTTGTTDTSAASAAQTSAAATQPSGTVDQPARTETQTVTAFDTTLDGISFGISPQDLLVKINEMGLTLDMPDYTAVATSQWPSNAVLDGRWYSDRWDSAAGEAVDDVATMDFIYTIKQPLNFGVTYDYMGNMKVISAAPSTSTGEGLKVGDSYDRMLAVYGDNYVVLNLPEGTAYRYFNGQEYLFVAFHEPDGATATQDTDCSIYISTQPTIGNSWLANG